MQRALIFLNLTLIAAGACACGDKMMLVMGARSSRIKPIRPAMILAYPGQNASATVIRDLQRQLAAKKARHRLQIVEDHGALDSALRAGKYDLVIADVANANELSDRLPVSAVETDCLARCLPSVESRTGRRPEEVSLPFEGSRRP
jgi:hypothetical protein